MKKFCFVFVLLGILVAVGIKTGVIQMQHPIDA
jgi:hypothetical protein